MADREEVTYIVLDSERIIVEVEKGPALYNKELKDYSDRNAKEKLWIEVCANVISRWHELSERDVQKKWKNLRDCFARELAIQKKIKSGEPARKRRKYIYFDALLFLLPHQQPRATSSNVEPPNDDIQLPDDDIQPPNDINDNEGPRNETGESSNDNSDPPRSVPSAEPSQRAPRSCPSKSQTSTFEASLIEILKNKQNEEVSEDKSFALMLAPMLAKLNDEQKHFAKIEILSVLRNAKFYTTPFPQQAQQQANYTQPGRSAQTNFHPPLHPGPHNMQSHNSTHLPAASSQFSSQASVGLAAGSPQYSNHSDNSISIQRYYSQFSKDILSPTSTDDNAINDF
ncbi:unnamed protein product [Ceutorhynchus assimilis]|uniref:Transcription factor Adf-1 n=1 Tax=Ceutorhynchus assimilis TaxID=467358 RepID=A0A9N9QJ19_9CUCU|nr:unnamed protein product [Ceutorhynchus assimilis]